MDVDAHMALLPLRDFISRRRFRGWCLRFDRVHYDVGSCFWGRTGTEAGMCNV